MCNRRGFAGGVDFAGRHAGLRTAAGAEIGRGGGRVEPRFGVDQEAARGGHLVARA